MRTDLQALARNIKVARVGLDRAIDILSKVEDDVAAQLAWEDVVLRAAKLLRLIVAYGKRSPRVRGIAWRIENEASQDPVISYMKAARNFLSHIEDEGRSVWEAGSFRENRMEIPGAFSIEGARSLIVKDCSVNGRRIGLIEWSEGTGPPTLEGVDAPLKFSLKGFHPGPVETASGDIVPVPANRLTGDLPPAVDLAYQARAWLRYAIREITEARRKA